MAEIKLTYFSSISVSFLVCLLQASRLEELTDFLLGVFSGPAMKAMDLFQQCVF